MNLIIQRICRLSRGKIGKNEQKEWVFYRTKNNVKAGQASSNIKFTQKPDKVFLPLKLVLN